MLRQVFFGLSGVKFSKHELHTNSRNPELKIFSCNRVSPGSCPITVALQFLIAITWLIFLPTYSQIEKNKFLNFQFFHFIQCNSLSPVELEL